MRCRRAENGGSEVGVWVWRDMKEGLENLDEKLGWERKKSGRIVMSPLIKIMRKVKGCLLRSN